MWLMVFSRLLGYESEGLCGPNVWLGKSYELVSRLGRPATMQARLTNHEVSAVESPEQTISC